MSNLAQKLNALAIQVKALLKNNGIVVIDGFNSDSTTSPASANTAKTLKSLYDGIVAKIGLTIDDGIAPLLDGIIPSQYLPSYIDDALEFVNLAAFPLIGESGKIYVAANTNLIYRWTGSAYVLIGDGTSVDVIGVGATAFPRYDQVAALNDADKSRFLANIGAKKSHNLIDKTASYALQLSDFQDAVDLYDKVYLRMNVATANNVTVDATLSTLPVLAEISVRNVGAGFTTLVADGTVLNGILVFSVVNEVKTLIKVGVNEWDVIGALT